MTPIVSKALKPPVETKQTALLPLILLCMIVLLAWSAWATLLRPWLIAEGSTPGIAEALLPRLAFWVLPCGIYLYRYWGKRALEPLGLSLPQSRAKALKTIGLTLMVALFFIVTAATQLRTNAGSLLLQLGKLSTPSLTAPIVEELVFRGVILSEAINWARDSSRSATDLRVRFWSAFLGANFAFVAVHLPFWMTTFGFEISLSRTAPLLAFSLLVSFVFAHTRNLWACIFLHALNNQLSLLAPT